MHPARPNQRGEPDDHQQRIDFRPGVEPLFRVPPRLAHPAAGEQSGRSSARIQHDCAGPDHLARFRGGGVPDSITAQLNYSVATPTKTNNTVVPIYIYDPNPADCEP